jgi:hypothetical protein
MNYWPIRIEEAASMDEKFVFAAAQLPFATGGGLHFCTLAPLCRMSGEIVVRKMTFLTMGYAGSCFETFGFTV